MAFEILTVRVPPEIKQVLIDMAKEENISMNTMVVNILSVWFKDELCPIGYDGKKAYRIHQGE